MDDKQDKILEIKFVGHVVDEKDLTKPEFAGRSIGTPVLATLIRTADQIRAVWVNQFELHVVQEGETACGQKPGAVVIVMEDGKYAAISEMNTRLEEAIRNDLFEKNGPQKLDAEALDQVVGGKIKFSWKNLCSFVGSIVGGPVGIVAHTALAAISVASTIRDAKGGKLEQMSDAEVKKFMLTNALNNLLPFEVEL